jgi:hypothetical protein
VCIIVLQQAFNPEYLTFRSRQDCLFGRNGDQILRRQTWKHEVRSTRETVGQDHTLIRVQQSQVYTTYMLSFGTPKSSNHSIGPRRRQFCG